MVCGDKLIAHPLRKLIADKNDIQVSIGKSLVC